MEAASSSSNTDQNVSSNEVAKWDELHDDDLGEDDANVERGDEPLELLDELICSHIFSEL